MKTSIATQHLTILALLSYSFLAQAEPALPSASAHALAFMAPADRWAMRLELRSNGWDKQFNHNGDLVDMDVAFNQTNLDSSLFPVLTALGANASLGTTAFDTEVQNQFGELALGYGVNDDLTIGVLIPFGRTRSDINFSVTGGNTGFNPAFDPAQPITETNFPFAPVGAGASESVGTEGMQKILTDPGFGYDYTRVESTTTVGLGDPTLGAIWRFYKTTKHNLVLSAGIQLGVADGDDPDNLMDVAIGDSSTDLRAQLEYFRDLGYDFDLRLMVNRKIQTKDHKTLRVPASGQLLATAKSKERLNRDKGDFWEFDVEVGRRWGDWRTSATWHRYVKAYDRYRSDLGTDTSALEANTNVFANQWRISISWSGINAWRQKKMPFPLIVKLEMQETYQGRNFVDVRDFYVRMTSIF